MHIAFILPNLYGGGSERSVLGLARGLLNRGHDIDLVLFESEIYYTDELPNGARLFIFRNTSDGPTGNGAAQTLKSAARLSGSVHPLDWARTLNSLNWDPRCLPHRGLIRRARAVAGYMECEKPDCVVPNLPLTVVATLLGGRFLRQPPPIIPTIRNLPRSEALRHKRWLRRLSPHASRFVGVSNGVSDDFAATIGVPRDRITTIYNPVVTPDLQVKMAEPSPHPWLLDGATPVILAAGRLVKQKDYPTLIKAFARVAARRPCRLIILGEGPLQQDLETLVRQLDLGDRVSLPGWVKNPFAFMARASLFVSSSEHEGLPGVLIQAMACGCPCVSTDCPAGPAEILDNGKDGALVPVGNHVELAEAMGRGLDRPPDTDGLRKRAAHFSVERAVAAYEELLSALVSSNVDYSAH